MWFLVSRKILPNADSTRKTSDRKTSSLFLRTRLGITDVLIICAPALQWKAGGAQFFGAAAKQDGKVSDEVSVLVAPEVHQFFTAHV